MKTQTSSFPEGSFTMHLKVSFVGYFLFMDRADFLIRKKDKIWGLEKCKGSFIELW